MFLFEFIISCVTNASWAEKVTVTADISNDCCFKFEWKMWVATLQDLDHKVFEKEKR